VSLASKFPRLSLYILLKILWNMLFCTAILSCLLPTTKARRRLAYWRFHVFICQRKLFKLVTSGLNTLRNHINKYQLIQILSIFLFYSTKRQRKTIHYLLLTPWELKKSQIEKKKKKGKERKGKHMLGSWSCPSSSPWVLALVFFFPEPNSSGLVQTQERNPFCLDPYL